MQYRLRLVPNSTGSWIAAFLIKVKPAGLALPTPTPGVPPGQPAQVTRIVDGDTIEVSISGVEQKVCYILINTPETNQPFGTEATVANRALVAGQTVTLVKNVSETDRYGRLLRYVYLPDGDFVNAELLRQGFAQVATYPPDMSKETEIRTAEAEVRVAGRGSVAHGAHVFWPRQHRHHPQRQPSRGAGHGLCNRGDGAGADRAGWEWRMVADGRRAVGLSRAGDGSAHEYSGGGGAGAGQSAQQSGSAVVPMVAPTPVSGNSQLPAYTCADNPAPPPDPACPIKGNISSGGRIFHTLGQRDYCKAVIDEGKGERWFCSAAEAEAAGWRAAQT